jgi:hypothetical protein
VFAARPTRRKRAHQRPMHRLQQPTRLLLPGRLEVAAPATAHQQPATGQLLPAATAPQQPATVQRPVIQVEQEPQQQVEAGPPQQQAEAVRRPRPVEAGRPVAPLGPAVQAELEPGGLVLIRVEQMPEQEQGEGQRLPAAMKQGRRTAAQCGRAPTVHAVTCTTPSAAWIFIMD